MVIEPEEENDKEGGEGEEEKRRRRKLIMGPITSSPFAQGCQIIFGTDLELSHGASIVLPEIKRPFLLFLLLIFSPTSQAFGYEKVANVTKLIT